MCINYREPLGRPDEMFLRLRRANSMRASNTNKHISNSSTECRIMTDADEGRKSNREANEDQGRRYRNNIYPDRRPKGPVGSSCPRNDREGASIVVLRCDFFLVLKWKDCFRGVYTPTPHEQIHGGDPRGHPSKTFLTKAEKDASDKALLPLFVANI